jgi:hypothetical protein
MIAESILEGLQDTTWRPCTKDTQTKKLIKDQTQIGWQHILFGRIAKEITKLLNYQPLGK